MWGLVTVWDSLEFLQAGLHPTVAQIQLIVIFQCAGATIHTQNGLYMYIKQRHAPAAKAGDRAVVAAL